MKLKTLLATAASIIIVSQVQGIAADWYSVNLRGTCKSVDGSDRIIRQPFNNSTLIQNYLATQEEPPLAKHLKVAYDPEADRISIVDTNGESVLDLYSFGAGTTIANSTDTLRERQMFLFLGGDSEAAGSAQISERLTRTGEGVITKITSRGILQFANPAVDELPAEVCSGTFTVGKQLRFAEPPAAPVE